MQKLALRCRETTWKHGLARNARSSGRMMQTGMMLLYGCMTGAVASTMCGTPSTIRSVGCLHYNVVCFSIMCARLRHCITGQYGLPQSKLGSLSWLVYHCLIRHTILLSWSSFSTRSVIRILYRLFISSETEIQCRLSINSSADI